MRVTKRLMAALLACLMLLSLLPVPAYAADDGRIALLAVTQDGYVIEPEYIGYRSGDTVKDVLKNSGHTFSGIDSGFITAVDGRTDNYSLHYDGDGYALDASAKGLTAIWFTTNANQSYGDDLLHLAERMAAYNTSTNGLKDYAAAKEAYDAAHSGFYAAANAAAAPLRTALENAIETADSMKSRGYGLRGRTAFSIYRMEARDRYALAWLGFCGLYLLCMQNGFGGVERSDMVLLLCAVLFSFQIMAVNHYGPQVDGVRLSLRQFFVVAVESSVAALLLEHPAPAEFAVNAVPLLYCGVMSSGVAYTLQILGQRDMNPAVGSLIMCLESVFSALGGWVLLHQSLSPREGVGCVLIFAAVVLAQLPAPQRAPQRAERAS